MPNCATTLPKDVSIYTYIEPDECLKRTHCCGYYGSDVGIMGHSHHFRPTAQFQLNGSTVSQILDLARYAKLLINKPQTSRCKI